jgi:hypothetical protein
LPERFAGFVRIFDEAWKMLFRLIRHAPESSGLPGIYIGTAEKGFYDCQFVWDSSFTAMAYAYGTRALPWHSTLDLLYSRQFDGGYIHRQTSTADGLPILFEPDFSPNPPLLSVAEWNLYRHTANRQRLRDVYPVLKNHHDWLTANRRLPNGVYWTTGLANGLDNSPSLGEGYPDLTAQMAHDAETLGAIADEIGLPDDAERWRREHHEIGEALNRYLWDPDEKIYATNLKSGGYNKHKVVTAFWPLWAGVVPPERVESLATHLLDPASFWRPHPIPSLAADSPAFRPGGDYWLGSVWAPTNFAAIKGFERAGRHDLALRTSVAHLERMLEVYDQTGALWENYCSEESKPGSWSGNGYSWTAAAPIALMFEIVLGINIDAPRKTIRWKPPIGERSGVENLTVGDATVSLKATPCGDEMLAEIDSDRHIRVVIEQTNGSRVISCRPGKTKQTFNEQ